MFALFGGNEAQEKKMGLTEVQGNMLDHFCKKACLSVMSFLGTSLERCIEKVH